MADLLTEARIPPVMSRPQRGAARIVGIGAYRPERIVSNEEICQHIDSDDAWIRTRSGIVSRRFAGSETIPEMAAWAASKALSVAGIVPADVSCVVLATMSHLHQAPPAAAVCAAELGADGAVAFDVGAACAGFSHALAIANSLVCSGEARYVVVAGAERMSDIVDPRDRGTAFLFGDGAGAVVVGPASRTGIGPVVWGSDTTHLHAIEQSGSFAALKTPGAEPWPYLEMAGREVYRWAIGALAGVARDALDAAGLKPGDINAFIPHQANLRITDNVVGQLGLPDSVEVSRQIRDDGNTSAASIPLALESLISAGRVRPGDLALLVGFGSGLSYSAQVIAVP
ncbi:beta-ketoacyl-ACP synthase 3 [Catenulispora pinisilvae]|uniref:beta-ketoacyl-ACP synthase 3 n=2 Tax=Catenulispora pinisilvae TaxID=2705253 RepID=UPI001E543AAE|nr:beta-ketoacyl-ACP synthase 3 [Catenulispora pinisilvae]